MRVVFIELSIQDGEREHNHRVLLHTKCENLDFAVQYYAAHYWGESELYRSPFSKKNTHWLAWGGEIAIRVDSYKEVPPEDLKVLNKYII